MVAQLLHGLTESHLQHPVAQGVHRRQQQHRHPDREAGSHKGNQQSGHRLAQTASVLAQYGGDDLNHEQAGGDQQCHPADQAQIAIERGPPRARRQGHYRRGADLPPQPLSSAVGGLSKVFGDGPEKIAGDRRGRPTGQVSHAGQGIAERRDATAHLRSPSTPTRPPPRSRGGAWLRPRSGPTRTAESWPADPVCSW